jgi:alpha-beta hydrolase superfamily lysophospholipase
MMEHAEGKFSGVAETQLYSQRWRPAGASRATLAIVHGFGEHSGRYMNVVNALVPRGYAVHGFDLRGHGRSPGQRAATGACRRLENGTPPARGFAPLRAAWEYFPIQV